MELPLPATIPGLKPGAMNGLFQPTFVHENRRGTTCRDLLFSGVPDFQIQ